MPATPLVVVGVDVGTVAAPPSATALAVLRFLRRARGSFVSDVSSLAVVVRSRSSSSAAASRVPTSESVESERSTSAGDACSSLAVDSADSPTLVVVVVDVMPVEAVESSSTGDERRRVRCCSLSLDAASSSVSVESPPAVASTSLGGVLVNRRRDEPWRDTLLGSSPPSTLANC